MEKVLGLGGIFFKSRDPKALAAWYRDNLGLDVEDWGGARFPDGGAAGREGYCVWSPFSEDSDYMSPGTKPWMVNFRVADLNAMVAQLRQKGAWVADRIDESEYGKFAWTMDPDGQKIELWEPPIASVPSGT